MWDSLTIAIAKLFVRPSAPRILLPTWRNWVAEYNQDRVAKDLAPIAESDEFELTRLRRLSTNLYSSAKVPVAAAVYGPSQVGKSLFVGRVLVPSSDDYSPLGRDEQLGAPAYYKTLSFDNDLNPGATGSNEATALVTRFTTKDRIASTSPEYPVMVRALTRSQWIRVLARGYAVECVTPDRNWTQRATRRPVRRSFQALPGDRAAPSIAAGGWTCSMRTPTCASTDRRGYQSKESVVDRLLNRYPLSDDGYIAIAANIFWNNWGSLTSMFMKINEFLEKISSPHHDPAILTHWAGVRFLLDSQRKKVHESRQSRVFPRLAAFVNFLALAVEQKPHARPMRENRRVVMRRRDFFEELVDLHEHAGERTPVVPEDVRSDRDVAVIAQRIAIEESVDD